MYNPNEKTELIKILRRIAEKLETTSVSASQFYKRSQITKHKVVRLFGSYNALVGAAGLVRSCCAILDLSSGIGNYLAGRAISPSPASPPSLHTP